MNKKILKLVQNHPIDYVESELKLKVNTELFINDMIDDLDKRYTERFFKDIWKPRTSSHRFTGWDLVNEVNRHNPKNVLDFGCGYNQFKNKINNLVGIDPYNESADYKTDIFNFETECLFDAILILGSLNFNEKEDIISQFEKLLLLLNKNGRMYFRANPGIIWKEAPYVDIFNWNIEFIRELCNDYKLTICDFKYDSNDRLYFVLSR